MNKPNELGNIYKYTSLESGSKILSGLTLKFTNPRDFNDPFDCNMDGVYFDTASVDGYTANDLKVLHNEFPTLKDNLHLIAPAFESSVKNKIEQCAVTCFSRNAKSELMWAHYGDSHRGMCIEFNNSLFEQFHKIKIDVEGNVIYNVTEKVKYCEVKIKGLHRIFLTKAAYWSYEQEYRMLTLNGAGYHEFKSYFINSVTFGLRVTDDKIQQVKNLC